MLRMKKMGLNKYLNIIAIIAMTLAGSLHAKISAPIEVIGEAAIINDDKSQALKQAKKEAMRKAIEQGGGVSVESQTIVENFQLVSDQISTSAKGVIVDPSWGQPEYKDGVVRISLNTKVSQEKLQDAICAVVKANQDPKIAVVMVEKVGKGDAPYKPGKGVKGPLEQRVVERFLRNCFTIVESGISVTATSDGDFLAEDWNKIKKNVSADYVVIGKAYVVDKGPVHVNMNSKQASRLHNYSMGIDLKLMNLETGELEVAVHDSLSNLGALNVTSAMRLKTRSKKTEQGCSGSSKGVLNCVMKQMFAKISKRWQNDLVNASVVQVEVRGVKNYKMAKDFRLGVEKLIPGAKVNQKKLRGGVAYLTIEVEGGADQLASLIDDKKFGRAKVSVQELVRGKLILELK